MENAQIIYLLTFLTGIVSLVAPIIKLNNTITKLDTTLKYVIERQKEDRIKIENLEKR